MKVVGPGDVIVANMPLPCNLTGAQLTTGASTPKFDVISYHFYPAVAPRRAPANTPLGTSPELSMTDAWFERTEKSLIDHKTLRDRYTPGAPIWNTETAGAACSGAPWRATGCISTSNPFHWGGIQSREKSHEKSQENGSSRSSVPRNRVGSYWASLVSRTRKADEPHLRTKIWLLNDHKGRRLPAVASE